MSRHLVIGAKGEVGRALADVLELKHEVYRKDLEPLAIPSDKPIQFMHVCLDFHGMGGQKFFDTVKEYLKQYNPKILDICSTTEPGTTALFGPNACHSTTRGLHPNLKEGLLKIVKHIGGPKASILQAEFEKVGIKCVTHGKAITTELGHILNNSAYGVSLMFAQEAAELCRSFGVDYFEAVMKYTATHNDGFRALDHDRLVRPILMPPGKKIGGHCVVQGAGLLPMEKRGKLLEMLAHYNDEKTEKPDGETEGAKQESVSEEPKEQSGEEYAGGVGSSEAIAVHLEPSDSSEAGDEK